MTTHNLSNIHHFGATEFFLFVISLTFGTAYTIYSKILMDMPGSSTTDDILTTPFQKPLALTFGMFIGMSLSLVVHWCVLLFRFPFPGYDFNNIEIRTEQSKLLLDESGAAVSSMVSSKNSFLWMYGYLIIPAIFDMAAIVLCMIGLKYVNVSTYQMLRGSGMIFIALMKQCILTQYLHKFHWVGVFWNVVGVLLIGSAAVLGNLAASALDGGESESEHYLSTAQKLWGVLLLILGTFIMTVQFVIEERVMKKNTPAPLLVGMEGLWGIVLSGIVMFPVGYYSPGDDNGSYEDPFHTWSVFANSPYIQVAFTIYCFTAFGYNLFAVLLAFKLSSVWRAILDNFRSISVWVTSLVIFYCIDPSFGEMWTRYSYLQVVGLVILMYGTAIYNAPNNGSIFLEGQWWALGIDLSAEYEAIRREQKVDVDAHLVYENLAEEYDAIIQKEGDEAGNSQVNL